MIVAPAVFSTLFLGTTAAVSASRTILRGSTTSLPLMRDLQDDETTQTNNGNTFSGRRLSRRAQGLPAPAIISNGAIKLGINPTGELNVPGGSSVGGSSVVGLRYIFEDESVSVSETIVVRWLIEGPFRKCNA